MTMEQEEEGRKVQKAEMLKKLNVYEHQRAIKAVQTGAHTKATNRSASLWLSCCFVDKGNSNTWAPRASNTTP